MSAAGISRLRSCISRNRPAPAALPSMKLAATSTQTRSRSLSTGSDYLQPVSAELSSVVTQFRNVIANHFTDDELNHLGSSRHFFPITFIPTDSQRILSPTSQKSPGRK